MRYLHLLYRKLQFETKYFLTYPDLECELIEERRIDIAKQYYTKEEP